MKDLFPERRTLNFNLKKTDTSFKKMGRMFEKIFTKEVILMINKHMKDVQHQWSLGKCKLNSYWDTSTHLLKYLRKLATLRVD